MRFGDLMIVPYQAKKDFPITPEYTVPKGTLVSIFFWI
jgi:cytochrome P450